MGTFIGILFIACILAVIYIGADLDKNDDDDFWN